MVGVSEPGETKLPVMRGFQRQLQLISIQNKLHLEKIQWPEGGKKGFRGFTAALLLIRTIL